MKNWYEAMETEDVALDSGTIFERIKKDYVCETCEHEEDAYINCISCVFNLLFTEIDLRNQIISALRKK